MEKSLTLRGLGVGIASALGIIVLLGSSISSGGLAVSNFPMAGITSAGSAYSLATWTTNAAVCASSTVAGPNAAAYSVCDLPLVAAGDTVMVQLLATGTWSASAGTVDAFATVWQDQGDPVGGSWSFSFYLGCAASGGGTFTYGVASTTVGSPPNQFDYETFGATKLRLNGCAPGSAFQVWMQRGADQGGSSGLTPKVVALQVVVRGS